MIPRSSSAPCFGRQAVAALLLIASPLLAWAGNFQVSPTLAEVSPGTGVASFTVRNSDSAALSFQVDAYDWSADTAAPASVRSTDLVVVPRIATVAPGATQLVRVALRDPVRDGERAFRIHFIELPPSPPPGFVGVQTAVRLDIPLFFRVADAAPAMSWSARRAGTGGLTVHGHNHGGGYLRLAALRVLDPRGAVLAERKGPLYVLAGQQVEWPLVTHAETSAGDPATLQLDVAGEPLQHQIRIE